MSLRRSVLFGVWFGWERLWAWAHWREAWLQPGGIFDVSGRIPFTFGGSSVLVRANQLHCILSALSYIGCVESTRALLATRCLDGHFDFSRRVHLPGFFLCCSLVV